MFESYDTVRFGKYMRSVRKSLDLTQSDVVEICKINIETLRRLEKGHVIPKYETIEFLSKAYKMDVMSLFGLYRTSKQMHDFYNYIDDLIIAYNLEALKTLEDQFKLMVELESEQSLITPCEIEQLRLMTTGIKHYYDKHFQQSLDTFICALSLSIKDFNIKTYYNHRYSLLEARLLLMAALSLAEVNELHLSNAILELVLSHFLLSNPLSNNQVFLIIKCYCNLAYNFHLLGDYKKALQFSAEGITFSKRYKTFYCLFLLYYRSGISRHLLNDQEYKQDLALCSSLLTMEENFTLLDLYKKVTYQKYGLVM